MCCAMTKAKRIPNAHFVRRLRRQIAPTLSRVHTNVYSISVSREVAHQCIGTAAVILRSVGVGESRDGVLMTPRLVHAADAAVARVLALHAALRRER